MVSFDAPVIDHQLEDRFHSMLLPSGLRAVKSSVTSTFRLGPSANAWDACRRAQSACHSWRALRPWLPGCLPGRPAWLPSTCRLWRLLTSPAQAQVRSTATAPNVNTHSYPVMSEFVTSPGIEKHVLKPHCISASDVTDERASSGVWAPAYRPCWCNPGREATAGRRSEVGLLLGLHVLRDTSVGSYRNKTADADRNRQQGGCSTAGDWAPYEHMLEELQARADKDARRERPAAAAAKPAAPKDKKRR